MDIKRVGAWRRLWSCLPVLVALLAFAVPMAQVTPAGAQSNNASVTGAQLPTSAIGPGLNDGLQLCGPGVCCLCGLFAALERVAPPYTQMVYKGLANALMVRIVPCIVVVTFGILLLHLFLQPGKAIEHGTKFASQFILVTFVVSIMTAGSAASSSGNLWVYDWIIMPLQQAGILAAEESIKMGAGAASTIIGPGAKAFPSSFRILNGGGVPEGSYTHLWASVETIALPLVKITANEMDGFWRAVTFGWLPYMILATPYVFVLGIFGAFMVQTMFYFIACSAAAPVMIAMFLFEKTRFYLFGALKFVVGGAMTILFAGVAMGFTGFILFSYLGQLNADTAVNGTFFEWVWDRVTNEGKGGGSFTMSSSAYWMIFLLGFISALLHLAAPRIASNISGSQDTATSAAFVTAAGQFLGAKAIGWMYKGARGSVGLGAKGVGGLGSAGGALMDRMRQSLDGPGR